MCLNIQAVLFPGRNPLGKMATGGGGGGSGVGESVEWYRVLVTGIPTNSNREVSVCFSIQTTLWHTTSLR